MKQKIHNKKDSTILQTTTMRKEIFNFGEEMEKKMAKHDKIKGDSYKTSDTSFNFLEGKIDEEYTELKSCGKIRCHLPESTLIEWPGPKDKYGYMTLRLPNGETFNWPTEENKENRIKDPEMVKQIFRHKMEECLDLALMCMMMHWKLTQEVDKIEERQRKEMDNA